jgi:hypothetical protein
MQGTGIWEHRYVDTSGWGWIIGKLGARLRLSDVVERSWLSLQSPVDYIPHPYHIYRKCFSTLICCGWTDGCILTLIYLWRWGWNFRKMGWLLSLTDVVRSDRAVTLVEAPKPCRLVHPTSISYIYKLI